MNDLRRILLWLSILAVLAIGIWGLQWDEMSGDRPFATEHREFRLNHRVEVLGRVFHLPLDRMLCAWAAVVFAAAALWPLATPERSCRWVERWGNPGPGAR